MTIKESMELLRAVIPANERTVGINVEVMDYDHYAIGDPNRCQVRFRVWDGREGYYGASLEIATQKALLANVPDRGTVEDADALAAEAGLLAAETGVEHK